MSPADFPMTFVDAAGFTYVNRSVSSLQAGNVADADILPAYQKRVSTQIDDDAETARKAVITANAGQAMEYEEARAQATAALASPSTATPALYPMLAATIGIDVDPSTNAPSVDVLGVARAVIAAYTAWATLGAAIRGTRVKGKAAVAAATTCAAVTAAYTGLVWPSTAGTAQPASA